MPEYYNLEGGSEFIDVDPNVPKTAIARREYVDPESGETQRDIYRRNTQSTSGAFASQKDNIRLLPRTNFAKRLRSITFMLMKVTPLPGGEREEIETVHTLLIAPQSYQQDEPNRSTVVQTLGGAFIDDFGLGLKQINISGHTGFSMRMMTSSIPTLDNTDSAIIATDGYQAFRELRGSIYRAYFDINEKTNVMVNEEISRDFQIDSSGKSLRNRNVRVDARNRDQSLNDIGKSINESNSAKEARRKKQFGKTSEDAVKQSKYELRMYYWGNEDYYTVHPLSFSFSQTADEPVLYRYNMSFLVLEDLSASEAKRALERASYADPLTNLADARYRSVLANNQIQDRLLYFVVKSNYKDLQTTYSAYNNTGPCTYDSIGTESGLAGNIEIWRDAVTSPKVTPTLVSSYDNFKTRDILTSNDPYLTSGDLGQIGYRDNLGRDIVNNNFKANVYNQLGSSTNELGDQVLGLSEIIVEPLALDFRDLVVEKSYQESLLRGMTNTKTDVYNMFDIVDREFGNFPPGYGEETFVQFSEIVIEGNATIDFGAVEGIGNQTKNKKRGFNDIVKDIKNTVNEAGTKVNNFVNARDTKLERNIEKWKGYSGNLVDLEREILAFPAQAIPYDLINNIRQVRCDLDMLARFPELFEDSWENAINQFRNLLKNSGCAQTL